MLMTKLILVLLTRIRVFILWDILLTLIIIILVMGGETVTGTTIVAVIETCGLTQVGMVAPGLVIAVAGAAGMVAEVLAVVDKWIRSK